MPYTVFKSAIVISFHFTTEKVPYFRILLAAVPSSTGVVSLSRCLRPELTWPTPLQRAVSLVVTAAEPGDSWVESGHEPRRLGSAWFTVLITGNLTIFYGIAGGRTSGDDVEGTSRQRNLRVSRLCARRLLWHRRQHSSISGRINAWKRNPSEGRHRIGRVNVLGMLKTALLRIGGLVDWDVRCGP